jgi:hypothetical protein
VLTALIGVCAIAVGWWMMIFTSRQYGFRAWSGGVLLVIGGAIVYVLGGIGFYCHLAENASVFCGSYGASATRYSGTKYVYVLPVVVPELKFGNVQRHIFGADFVEGADHAALHQRPKTFNRIRVDRTDNVLLRPMANETMRVFIAKPVIGAEIVSCQQTDFVGNRFTDEANQRFAVEAIEDAGDNLPLTLYRANDTDLSRAAAAGPATPLIPMFVLVLPADVGFIYLDDAAQLIGSMFTEASADAIAHVERGLVGTEAHVTHDLQGTHALFANQHKVHDLEPVAERLVRVLKDRPDQNREPIAARLGAFGALPVKGTIGDGIHVYIAATGAMDAFRPAASNEISLAGILIREHIVKLLICKLFYRFDAGHFGLPYPAKRIWRA